MPTKLKYTPFPKVIYSRELLVGEQSSYPLGESKVIMDSYEEWNGQAIHIPTSTLNCPTA
jgi:hypothetical protein